MTATTLRMSAPIAVLAAAATIAMRLLPGQAPDRADIVAIALTLDFTVVTPALVYILFVRSKRAPWVVLVPTFLVGFGVASATLPADQRGLLNLLRFAIAPLEIGILIYLALLTRRAVAVSRAVQGDFPARVRGAALQVLGNRLAADIFATELSILYYAFAPAPGVMASERVWSVHRTAGYLTVVVGLQLAIAVETLALHALLQHWSSGAAWTFTAFSLYACIWLVGDYRAAVALPIRVTSQKLLIRVGLRQHADIPLALIAEARRVGARDKPPREALVATIIAQPNVRLRLSEPVECIGMYGIRRRVREIWLRVDEPHDLLAQFATSTIPR